MIRFTCSVIALVFLSAVQSHGQLPQNPIGLNPASLKWKQINSDKVQVIFPDGMEAYGDRVANLVHYLWENNQSVGDLNEKISILLHNQTTRPNGLVTPGPFRSEFYTRSPQFNCTSDWVDLLAIHEYQHVKQFANAEQGITKLGKIIFGSWAWGGLAATALPRWFFEGDATVQETIYSASGRGRLPTFHMQYKALIDANAVPSYELAGARSFKRFIPNWYPLGYYMNMYGRVKYGPELWSNVVSDAVRYKGLFYPFSQSLKRQTKLSTKHFYDETMLDLASYWRSLKKPDLRNDPASILSSETKVYTHYVNPHFVNAQTIVSIKSGFDHIPEIVFIDQNKKEQRFTAIGSISEGANTSVSFSNGVVCWAEVSLDPRWRYKNYSVIKSFNTLTREKKFLTKKSKYFSPELNRDATKIVSVEITENAEYKLVVLHGQDGTLLEELPNPNNLTLIHPTWKGDSIICVVQHDEQHYLVRYNNDGSLVPLTPPLARQISHPCTWNDWLIFSAAYQEINQIYATYLPTGKIYQLSNSALGAYMPSVSKDGTQVVFAEYTMNGYRVVKIPFVKESHQPFNPASYLKKEYGQAILDEHESILAQVPSYGLKTEKFRKGNKLINFHSILPTVSHPIYEVSLLSDNSFGTMRGEVTGSYNANERKFGLSGGFTFGGWYPEISARVTRRNRSAFIFDFTFPNDSTLQTNFFSEEWSENVGEFGVALPFRFQVGHFFHSLRFGVNAQYVQTNVLGKIDDPTNDRDTFGIDPRRLNEFEVLRTPLLGDQSFGTMELAFDWSSQRGVALRHLNPHFGLFASVRYRQSLDPTIDSRFFSAIGNVFLPGLKPTHSLWMQMGYRNQSLLETYRFPDRFIYPRGYGGQLSDEFSRFAINYSFPIWYPDVALGSIAFIQRVKLNAFFDASVLKIGFPFGVQDNLNSLGLDLTFDFRAFRLLDLDMGVRYSYLLNPNYAPNGNVHQFEFLVLNISG